MKKKYYGKYLNKLKTIILSMTSLGPVQVKQDSYEVFYERVMDLVKYGKVCHSYVKSPPKNMTEEEADLYFFYESCRYRSQLCGNFITLRGKKYGDLIDRKYKERYIDIMCDLMRDSWKSANLLYELELYELEKEVANYIKIRIKYENTDFSPEGIYAAGIKRIKESGFSQDIISMALEDYENNTWFKPKKKKSLWGKLKDYFE